MSTTNGVLKSGLNPDHYLMRGEDRAACLQLIARYYEEFRPACPVVRNLLDEVIRRRWNIDRYQRLLLEGGSLLPLWSRLLSSNRRGYRSTLQDLREYLATTQQDDGAQSLTSPKVSGPS